MQEALNRPYRDQRGVFWVLLVAELRGVGNQAGRYHRRVAGSKRPRRGGSRDQAAQRTVDRRTGSHEPHGETNMPQIEIEILTPFAAKFLEGTTLTPAEWEARG